MNARTRCLDSWQPLFHNLQNCEEIKKFWFSSQNLFYSYLNHLMIKTLSYTILWLEYEFTFVASPRKFFVKVWRASESVVQLTEVQKRFLCTSHPRVIGVFLWHCAQVFSCEFCEIFKNTFFCRTPLVAASDTSNTHFLTFPKRQNYHERVMRNFILKLSNFFVQVILFGKILERMRKH